MLNNWLSCPTDCGTVIQLPAIPNNQDCTAYNLDYSQVCGVLILPTGVALPGDWQSPDDWNDLVDNTDTSNTAGKYLIGEGQVPEPELDEVEYPKRIKRVVNRLYRLEFEVDNLNDATYAFLQKFQCGYTEFKFWIETVSGHLFGGSSGITPSFSDASFPLNGGRDDTMFGSLTIEFNADGDPPRAAVDLTGLTNVTQNNLIGDPDNNFIIGDPTQNWGIQ